MEKHAKTSGSHDPVNQSTKRANPTSVEPVGKADGSLAQDGQPEIYLQSIKQVREDARARMFENRDLILQYLKRVRATSVVVSYSGSGDDGGIDSVEIYRGKKEIHPKRKIDVQTEKSEWSEEKQTWLRKEEKKAVQIEEALKEFVYDWIEEKHAGWENNDGADGSCEIDVASGQFLLTHRDFYVESETTEHEL